MKERITYAARVASRLARDARIPRPIRALILFGALPIPGPVDEVALVAAGLWLAWRRPHIIADARHAAARQEWR